MFWEFSYKGYLVNPESWEHRTKRRIRWFGAITLIRGGRSHTITLEEKLFDWPKEARACAATRAKQIIDAYVAGGVGAIDPMSLGESPARPTPNYPRGSFSDSVSRF